MIIYEPSVCLRQLFFFKILVHFKFLIIVLSTTVSCQRNAKTIKADLSFRSIVFTSAYGAEKIDYDKVVNDIENSLKNSKLNDSINSEIYLLNSHLLKLHELNLLKLPNVYLHFGSDSIMEVHISEKEYNKIKKFNQSDLRKENKKVVLELDVEEIEKGIYFSDNIRSVKKIDGQSRSNIFKED